MPYCVSPGATGCDGLVSMKAGGPKCHVVSLQGKLVDL